MGGNRLTINFIKSEFNKENYTLLTEKYINNKQKLKYICSKRHKHNISWNKWQQGRRCPYCFNNIKKTIEFIKKEFKKENYILLTNEYKNAWKKLNYICPNKHENNITWHDWQQGHRCSICFGNVRLTIEFIRKQFENEGYTLLTEIYKNAYQKLYYICPKGHKHSIIWNSWQQKQRCPYCYGNAKPTIEFIKLEIEKEQYILISDKYINNATKLHLICPKGHNYYVSWNNWSTKGRRCPRCDNIGISKYEMAVKNFINKNNIKFIANDRTRLINPNTNYPIELDIWIPQLNKAIECNGVYWHSKTNRKQIDILKQQLCRQQKIDLLVITDMEWYEDTEKCKSIIYNFIYSKTNLR